MDMRRGAAALGLALVLGCGPGKGSPPPVGDAGSGTEDGTMSGSGMPATGAPSEGSTSASTSSASSTSSTSSISSPSSISSTSDTSSDTATSSSFIAETTRGGSNECFFVDPECERGMKCAVAGPTCEDYPECVPIGEGEKSLFESCQVLGCLGPDDCGPGAYCAFDSSDASPGTCLPACQHDWQIGIHCEDPNEQCILLASAAAIAVCGLVCDVLVQDCPDGMGCVDVYGSAGQFFTCVTLVEPKGVAEACEGPSDCQAGLACRGNVPGCSGGCCTPFCALGDPSGCDAVPGAVCESLADEFGTCIGP